MGSISYVDHLPQETLEAIIDELAGDRTSLMACHLVSKRWTWRSRRHLFKRVRFSSMWGSSSLRSWSAAMDLKDSPAAFTRSLRMSQREEAWITPLNLIQYFEHFRSFDRVESLTLSHFSFRIFDSGILRFLFRNLIPSVRRLRLHHPLTHPAPLLQLISIFPNLRDTAIYAPYWEPVIQQDSQSTTHYTLRGELRLCDLEEGSGPFLSLLGSQRTEYEQITLERCGFRDFSPLQRLISNTGMYLRKFYLFAEGNHRTEVPKISLSECTVLEFLSISAVGPETSFRRIVSMLSSVASVRLRKFMLEANLREFTDIYNGVVRSALVDGVGRLDRPLSTLAKRIACEGDGRLLFILLTHNALEMAQRLVELNREGDVLVGEKVIGGDHSCLYISAAASLRETPDGQGWTACNVHDFL